MNRRIGIGGVSCLAVPLFLSLAACGGQVKGGGGKDGGAGNDGSGGIGGGSGGADAKGGAGGAGGADGSGGAGGAGAAGGSGGGYDGGPPPASGSVGALSVIPKGASASGPFKKAWSAVIREGDLAKTVPVLADFTGDGKVDIFMNPRKASLSIYPGNGDGTFAAPKTGESTTGWGIDAVDFTGDSKVDGAIGDHGWGAKAFRNTGGGALADSSAGLSGDSLSGCALGDFNGDGKIDYLGGADQFGEGLYLAFGDGAGGWTAKSPSGLPAIKPGTMSLAYSNVGGFFVADFNGDGKLDFAASGVVGTGPSNDLFADVAINGGDGISWTRRRVHGPVPVGDAFGPDAIVISAADVSGDGKLDLAVAGTILLGDGAGGFKSAGSSGMPVCAQNHFGDIDGEGKMDLVVHDVTVGLEVWLGDGTGKGWKKADVGLGETADFGGGSGESMGIDVWDLDGNGRLDIVRAYKKKVRSTPLLDADTNYDNIIESWVR